MLGLVASDCLHLYAINSIPQLFIILLFMENYSLFSLPTCKPASIMHSYSFEEGWRLGVFPSSPVIGEKDQTCSSWGVNTNCCWENDQQLARSTGIDFSEAPQMQVRAEASQRAQS